MENLKKLNNEELKEKYNDLFHLKEHLNRHSEKFYKIKKELDFLEDELRARGIDPFKALTL